MRRLPVLLVLLALGVLGGAGAASAQSGSLERISGASPFAAGCNGAPQTGTNYRNAEVEPWVSSNPARPRNLVAVWQQDRWSNGGAYITGTTIAVDGGADAWGLAEPPPPTEP